MKYEYTRYMQLLKTLMKGFSTANIKGNVRRIYIYQTPPCNNVLVHVFIEVIDESFQLPPPNL